MRSIQCLSLIPEVFVGEGSWTIHMLHRMICRFHEHASAMVHHLVQDAVARPSMQVIFGYMPRGPNVAISLCIVSNAKQDLSYFCMWAWCPFLKRLARLSGHLAKHDWNTRAFPLPVATLSSVLRFLMLVGQNACESTSWNSHTCRTQMAPAQVAPAPRWCINTSTVEHCPRH